MVLTELMQNSVEHAFGARDGEAATGTIDLEAQRAVGRLHVVITDDGKGLPAPAAQITKEQSCPR